MADASTSGASLVEPLAKDVASPPDREVALARPQAKAIAAAEMALALVQDADSALEFVIEQPAACQNALANFMRDRPDELSTAVDVHVAQ